MKKNILYTALAGLLLAALAVFFFYPDDVEGRVLQQSDITQGLANGQEGKAFKEATGETTRWTDALFGGMPTYQINPEYPVNSMLGWAGKIYTLWLPSPANLLFGMMIGFFIMCLCLKMRWYEALLGAIGWGLSTYFIIIIGAGHIWKFMTLMYIPPTIGGIALCYRKKYVAGIALAALFGSLQLMSNHIQMSYYFMFVIVAMILGWLAIAYKEGDIKSWLKATGAVCVAGIIAVAANAPGLYNTYAYSKETTRGQATALATDNATASKGADIDYITQWSYGKDETFSLLIPNVKGGASVVPGEGGLVFGSLASTEKANQMYEEGKISAEELQFLGQFPQYFGEQPMTNGPVYVGALLLLLAILGIFVIKSSMKWALLAAAFVTILLSWGHNFLWFTEFFVNHFPAYNKFRTVASILVVAEFVIPLLAVMCIREITNNPDFFKRYKLQFLIVMCGGMLICLLGAVSPSIFGDTFTENETEMLRNAGVFGNSAYYNLLSAIKEIRLSMVSADCIRSFWFIAIGFAIMMLYFKGVIKKASVMVCLLAAIVLIDLWMVNKRYLNSENFNEPAPVEARFEMTNADKAILKDKSHYRVLDLADFSGARSSYFHKTVGGYHAAKLTRYNDLIEHQITKGNQEVLNMLNTKYFMKGDEYQLNPEANGNAWFVSNVTYVNTPNEEMATLDTLQTKKYAVADKSFEKLLGNGSISQPGDTISLTSYAPNKITYKSTSAKGGVAVFSEIYFPWGWNVKIDGKDTDLARVNYVLRAIRVPAGNHEIEFYFNPTSAQVTDDISIVSIVLIYILCVGALLLVALKLRKKKQ